MKRITAIFFLLLFLFNIGGYHLLFWGIQRQAKHALLQRLDAEAYSSGETIVLTIPLTLPYPPQQEGFHRVNGEFDYNGEHYKLVKQKLDKDVLYLVCLKDTKAKKIATAFSDYSKLANDLPSDSKQTRNMLGKLFKDFNSPIITLQPRINLLLREIRFVEPRPLLSSQDFTIDSPPPEVLA